MVNPAVARGLDFDNPLKNRRPTMWREEQRGRRGGGGRVDDVESKGSHDGDDGRAGSEVPMVNNVLANVLDNLHVATQNQTAAQKSTSAVPSVKSLEADWLPERGRARLTACTNSLIGCVDRASGLHLRVQKGTRILIRDDGVTSPMKGIQSCIPVDRAIGTITGTLHLAAQSVGKGCMAGTQSDVVTTPLSLLGKRGAEETEVSLVLKGEKDEEERSEMGGVAKKNLKWRLGMKSCFAVSSDGLSGGLALFWHECDEVELLPYSKRHIDVAVRLEAGAPQWRATLSMVSHGWRIGKECGTGW
ncbi:hypothetical protein EJB05_19049, partial [Eragrostis curvula]